MANCTKGFKPRFVISSCEFRSFNVKFVHNAANTKLYWLRVSSKSAICNKKSQFIVHVFDIILSKIKMNL